MNEEILTKTYPISIRWIIKRAFLYLIILFSILLGIYELEHLLELQNAQDLYRLTIFSGLALSSLWLGYLFLYIWTYQYKIAGDEFIITRGVIFKTPVGVPISKINAIHIKRKIHDIIFGLATVIIVVPGDIPTNLTSIAGLSLKNAEGLKAYIFTKN
jgi:uncharacterized membrane protein YdbT with pleckstrin-like domain